MKTEKSVADSKLTDEQLGVFTRRTDEIKRRLNEKTLSYDEVLKMFQLIIQGNSADYLNVFQTETTFPTWKTVQSKCESAEEMEILLKKNNVFEEDSYATKILRRYAYFHGGTGLAHQLVRVTPRDLGFKGNKLIQLGKIYGRALSLGLHVCEPQVAFMLRLDYLDQPKNEVIEIAMHPFPLEGNRNTVLTIVNGKSMRIGANQLFDYRTIGLDELFVFARA